MGSSHQGTTERNCAPSHLVVGNIKRHFLLELPWPPGQKHTHTALNRCSDCTLYYVPTYLSHLGPATKLWGRDDTLLTTTSQGGTQHAVDTQHTLCFFMIYPHLVPWQTTLLIIQDTIPSVKVSCLGPKQSKWFLLHLHSKFSLFCVSALSIRLCSALFIITP